MAAVDAGRHRLVYRYEPRSVRVGFGLSLAGVAGLLAVVGWAWRRPASSS